VSFPTSGPVVAGRKVENHLPRIDFFAAGPAGGETPHQIVRGFLRAAADFQKDHLSSRLFLSPASRTTWRPDSPVLVYVGQPTLDGVASAASSVAPSSAPSSPPSPPSPAPSSTPSSAPSGRHLDVADPVAEPGARTTVSLSVGVVAQVEAGGQYVAQPTGSVRHLVFHLVSVAGQWRIDQPPDGVLLSANEFNVTYGSVSLYFPDLSHTWLVPDVRWYPLSSSPTVAINGLLTDGPAEWLLPAVSNTWPSQLGLTSNGVKASEGTVVVDLNHYALDIKPEDRALLYAQIRETLQDARRVFNFSMDDLQLTVEQGRLQIPPPAAALPAVPDQISADPRPVVLVTATNRLARLQDSATAAPVDGLLGLALAGGGRPAVGRDGRSYALVTADRTRLYTQVPDDTPHLVTTGVDLTAPSVDRYGWAWTTPAAAAGKVFVGSAGRSLSVPAGWLAGARVTALRISPEGSRAVVLLSRGGSAPQVQVCAVVRDGDGTPIALSPAVSVVADLTTAQDVSWVDAWQVAVLGTRQGYLGRSVWLAQVGGSVQYGVSADNAQSLSVGSNKYQMWLQTSTGMLARAGASLLPVAGVRWPSSPG
jgi:hypothetical protein